MRIKTKLRKLCETICYIWYVLWWRSIFFLFDSWLWLKTAFKYVMCVSWERKIWGREMTGSMAKKRHSGTGGVMIMIFCTFHAFSVRTGNNQVEKVRTWVEEKVNRLSENFALKCKKPFEHFTNERPVRLTSFWILRFFTLADAMIWRISWEGIVIVSERKSRPGKIDPVPVFPSTNDFNL